MALEGFDAIEVKGRRITPEGFLIAPAVLARAGKLVYSAHELGLQDRNPQERINVFRSSETLEGAAPGFHGSPIVFGAHPTSAITAQTWRKHVVGDVRDVSASNGVLTGTLRICDAQAITGIERGTKSLSIGFSFDLQPLIPGHSSGCAYEQRNIRGNHIAIVPAGRCGSQCVIGDGLTPTQGDHTMRVEINGLPFDLPDSAAVAVQQQQTELDRLRGADRQFSRDVAAYAQVARFAADCGCSVRDDLNAHQLRVEVLKRLMANDSAIADMVRAGCQGRDVEHASPETLVAVFETVTAAKKAKRGISAVDSATALALGGSSSNYGSVCERQGRDAYIDYLENVWKTERDKDLEQERQRPRMKWDSETAFRAAHPYDKTPGQFDNLRS